MGDLQSLQCVPDPMPGDVEMARALRLGLIGVGFHMTAHLLPIQLVGTARTRPLVGQTARLEPTVHAGLAHLEPPRRCSFTAPASDKFDHPLTQV